MKFELDVAAAERVVRKTLKTEIGFLEDQLDMVCQNSSFSPELQDAEVQDLQNILQAMKTVYNYYQVPHKHYAV